MIALLLGLLILLQPTPNTYTGALSYAPLEKVVINRGWRDVDSRFDILLGVSNCDDLAKWADVHIKDGPTLLGLIVDCEHPKHAGQLAARGLAADGNLKRWVHWQVVIKVRE